MTQQSSMFSTSGYSRQTRPATPSEETRNASYADLQSDLGEMQREYLMMLRICAKRGFELKPSEKFYNLTDMEMANELEWQRSSVCGRRNELCGGSGSPQWIKDQPLVIAAGKRKCTITGRTATAWRPAHGLFDLSEAA